MTEELNTNALFSDLIRFLRRNKRILIIFTLFGVLSAVIFQTFKKQYYTTKAICTSYISEYERTPSYRELKQRTAVDLINHLQINIENKEYLQLAEALDVNIDIANNVKYIHCELLYQKNMKEEYLTTNKFEIELEVYDNSSILDIQKGLQNYFINNEYVKRHYELFKESNQIMIEEINKEIERLITVRSIGAKNGVDISSINIGVSNNIASQIGNQIIALSELKEELRVQAKLGYPLVYVQKFAKVNKTESDILILSLILGIISFVIGIIFSFIQEVDK